MAERRPLVYKDGKISELPSGDTTPGGTDVHSGLSKIPAGDTVRIEANKQMLNFFTGLTIDGDLILDGDLWLA